MAGTNEFAFFRCKGICTGGVQNQAEKKFEKCLPAGTGTKIYFASPEDPTIKKKLTAIEIFNLARNLISMSRFPHKKCGCGRWLARKFHSRSKFSISLEMFDLARKC